MARTDLSHLLRPNSRSGFSSLHVQALRLADFSFTTIIAAKMKPFAVTSQRRISCSFIVVKMDHPRLCHDLKVALRYWVDELQAFCHRLEL